MRREENGKRTGDLAVGNRILRLDNVRKTVNYLKKNGLSGTFYAAAERMQEERAAPPYRYQPPGEEALEAQRKKTGKGTACSVLSRLLMRPGKPICGK